jgi:hypothetical protein
MRNKQKKCEQRGKKLRKSNSTKYNSMLCGEMKNKRRERGERDENC